MKLLELEAKNRDMKVKAKDVRTQNLIPSVCYGKGFETKQIQVDYQGFRKLFKQVSTTQVFNLVVDGKETPVLVHVIGFNPLTDRVDHIDFLQVNMNEKITATVPVETEGDAPAIKNFNATVTVAKHEIEVRCLPMDIPHEIKIDLSKLENVGDTVYVRDLKLGDKVEILDDLEDAIVTVSAVEEFKEEAAEVPEELKVEAPAAGVEAAAGEKAEGKTEEAEDKKD